MATKEKLLALLQARPGVYLSGEDLASSLGVSRTAVWKAIKALQAQGCRIRAVTNRGYCLVEDGDLMNPGEISALVHSPLWSVEAEASVDSTNSRVRARALEGEPEGLVLLARTQTGGRGRMGRSFFSPPDTGLYLSLLLRPRDLSPDQALQLTTMAAAALCLAIAETTGTRPGIKWVNDLFLEKKKICGILTEAALDLETGVLDYAVLGLGLNLYPPEGGFPPELQQIAGSLLDSPESGLKNRLTAAFLDKFSDFYESRNFRAAAEVYRDHSILAGKTVLVEGTPARVLDITDRCQLLVRMENGETRVLSWGEVSIVNL